MEGLKLYRVLVLIEKREVDGERKEKQISSKGLRGVYIPDLARLQESLLIRAPNNRRLWP